MTAAFELLAPMRTGSSDDCPPSNPGHPLFNAASADKDGRRSGLLRRLISLPSKHPDPPLSPLTPHPPITPRASLVPPHYTPSFRPRSFPLVRNPAGWAEALIALPDNAVRAELADMYAIFAAMELRPLNLDKDDVANFYDWFASFFAVLHELFGLEDVCLYPWIEGVDLLPREKRVWETSRGRVATELNECKRGRHKGEIMLLGNKVKDCRSLFDYGPVAQSLPRLAEAVNAFVDELVAYLDLKARVLPPCIYAILRQKDSVRYERNFWDTASRQPLRDYTVVAATRWMDRKQLRKWKKKHLPRSAKSLYPNWKLNFHNKHYDIINRISNRVLQSEEERIKQAEDNEIARARAQHAHIAVIIDDATDSEPASGAIVADFTGYNEESEAASGSCASSARRSGLSAAFSSVPAVF